MKKILGLILVGAMLLSTAMARGTGANTVISAPSNNIILEFSDGGAGTASKTAAEDNIADWGESVLGIHGLLETGISLFSSNEGTPITNGHSITNYPVDTGDNGNIGLSYLNKSNETVTLNMIFDINKTSGWTIWDPALTVNVLEDQLVTFNIGFKLEASAVAFEKVYITTNIVISDEGITKNVVSYNAFDGATAASGDDGTYGGVDNIVNTFYLEGEGYNIDIVDRTIEIIAPDGVAAGTLVPGSKIKITVVVRNNSSSEATDLRITDVIPENCHMYYTDVPTLLGDAGYDWEGATDNTATHATADAIKFRTSIPRFGIVTASYTVTVD